MEPAQSLFSLFRCWTSNNFQNKCDALRPECSSCQASGHICTYNHPNKRRGLPEGYVQGLEKLLAMAICRIDNFEDSMLSILGATPESATQRTQQMVPHWTNPKIPKSLRRRWKDSRLYNTVTNPESKISKVLLSADDELLVAEKIGSPTPIDCSVPAPCIYDVPHGAPYVNSGSLIDKIMLPNEKGTSSTTGGSYPLPRLPDTVLQLLDQYSAVTQPWFPILEKRAIIRASHLYTPVSHTAATVAPGCGDRAVLWALFSYTASQSCVLLDDPSSSPEAETKKYYLVARASIPSENRDCELQHVQALLLLTLVNISFEQWVAARLLSSRAMDLALSMDLDKPTNIQGSDEEQLGKAVLFGCCITDSMLAFRLSQSPHGKFPDSRTLLNEDGVEEWSPWSNVLPIFPAMQTKRMPRNGPLHALSCYNHLFQLTNMMNQITPGPALDPGKAVSVEYLIQEFEMWDETLPLGCRLIGPESIYPERHSALLPHQTYLTLTYIAVLLQLYLQLAPQEIKQGRALQPAFEGAKKLLYRVLLIVTAHLDNFSSCGIPPIFALSLQSIVNQAAVLRDIHPCTFPFRQWAESLRQRILEICPALPVYRSLTATIERWYLMGNPSEDSKPSH